MSEMLVWAGSMAGLAPFASLQGVPIFHKARRSAQCRISHSGNRLFTRR